MATALDVSGLTLAAKENPDFDKFIIEGAFMRPELRSLHNVYTGITMKEQIILASQFGKTGIKGDSTCTRKTSGGASILTQKYWEPQGIEDTKIHCQAEISGLFKAYYDKIKSYREMYEIEGSDEQIFMGILLLESINRTIGRASWLASKSVAAAGEAVAGLKIGADSKFYDYIDGIWDQVFTGVGAGTLQRYAISENALGTIEAQTTLIDGRATEIFEAMWRKADSRLRSDATAKFYVSLEIFENYRKYLQSKGENYTIDYTTDGLPSLKWNGRDIVNMETIWDLDLRSDFVKDTTTNAYFLPNRALFTLPANIPIGTLNENDFTELEAWYERKDRTFYMSYGFSIDAKLLENHMAVAAY